MSPGPAASLPHSRPFQVVATLGPASWNAAQALLDAGATSLRINTSHVDLDPLGSAIQQIHASAPFAGVVLDLQGAKMRLGDFPPRPVRTGDRVMFGLEADAPDTVPLPHPELFSQIQRGETLRVDDDRLRFSVVARSARAVTADALNDGVLRPRKGVNLLEHPVHHRGLTDRDRAVCALAARSGSAALAVSFMADGSEAARLREVAPGCAVIGKVEQQAAIENLGAIDALVDEVWLCRGDLASQIGIAALARWMGGFNPSRLRHPVLVAGQVLEHLTANCEPTRSEACHLYDLWSRGYAGIVLSDETAVGIDPVRAVRIAAELIDGFRR